jgi:SAM-dependent methyltransferase
VDVERNKKVARLVGSGRRVLDVGCGQGELMLLLAKGNTVSGLDFSQKMVGVCRSKGLFVKLGDAEKIPFLSGSFDVVCAVGLVEYLKSDDHFFQEVHRVLVPHGFAVVSFRNELFREWSGRVFEPERRSHNPDSVEFEGFQAERIVFLHEHFPHRFADQKYFHSSFLAKLRKVEVEKRF